MAHTNRIGPALGLAAALAMAAPANAAALPEAPSPAEAPLTGSSLVFTQFDTSTYNPANSVNEWRRCGWRGCWRGRGWRGRGWRGRRGIGVGDVVAGAVIIGGIAAIASAASNNRRRDRDVVVVERDRRIDDRRIDDRRDNPRRSVRSTGSSGLDSAVDQCLTAIERDVRVENVDGASRAARGWIVTGSIFDGSNFACEIGNDGRIVDISYGGGAFRGSDAVGAPRQIDPINGRGEGQWSDDIYAGARASLDADGYRTAPQRVADASGAERPAQPLVPLTSDRMPAYPGGPLPGDE